MKYAAEMGSGVMIPSFIKTSSGIQTGIHRHTEWKIM
jgi:hypothetical protein